MSGTDTGPGPANAPGADEHLASSDQTQRELADIVAGLELRSIGPALMGGRIADIAVHPHRKSTWYLAVGSGGVWKTTNAGVTWTPIFEQERSYSIGCITIDPNRPETIWVGTGEAVSGRHVGWGDGVYRSVDAGATWQCMGLEGSEHIADILVDPRDSAIVHVAAEGPLWSSGGQRGLFTSRDGGHTWEPSLVVDDDTGVTSAVFAPDDPDTIYAATYQRRRNVRAFMGGGPGSGIHVSADGGRTWARMGPEQGLPTGNLGKIGLAVTPADPSLVYATVEAPEKGAAGFHRSTNRGRTWERRNGYLSGGTGPHYYQELFASPVDPAKVYQVDVFLHVTTDGGKTFNPAETGKTKHSDNHVVWVDPDDPDHLLVGCDAGLYETFDDCASFRHVSNLPISQFYRVAVDDAVPFANVLGGAQDLGTLHGPTRTIHTDGVRNQDWWVPLGADGYRTAFDPHDPAISYLEWQVGNVMRHDLRTMELTDIQPQGALAPIDGEPAAELTDIEPERFNWDTPIVCSPHTAGRIYVASQRVWRSDDRGDSWTPISGDLTRNRSRLELPVGDRVWSVDDLYDHMAMSFFSTITDLAESSVVDGLLYVGTDDGLVQISSDGGNTWRHSGVLPGLPEEAFVNDVEACLHHPDVAFVAADDHKSGDYTPYLFMTEDQGASWRSIRGDLPDGVIVWQIEQDHIDPDLLFVGAENGLYVSLDRGVHWLAVGRAVGRSTATGPASPGGRSRVPTIAMRDLAIQRRDDDLIAASFGRGFYVLDDYSPLRRLAAAVRSTTESDGPPDGPGPDDAPPATLFPIRRAWRYVPHLRMQAEGQPTLGSTAWRSPNPQFGATISYHVPAGLADRLRTTRAARRAAEELLDAVPTDDSDAAGSPTSGPRDIPFPGWDTLREERLEHDPVVRLLVRDAGGDVVRALAAPTTKGLHRLTWDLRRAPHDPVSLETPAFVEPWVDDPVGPLCGPGRYQVELVRVRRDGTVERLAGPEPVEVTDVVAAPTDGDAPDLGPTDDADGAAFGAAAADLRRRIDGAAAEVRAAVDRLRHLRAALATAPTDDAGLFARLERSHRRIESIGAELTGDPVVNERNEPPGPSVKSLADRAGGFHLQSTSAPTETQRATVERATAAFGPLRTSLDDALEELAELTLAVDDAGGTWTPR